jgi:hypothetical protein
MGHLYHGYVTNYQRVDVALEKLEDEGCKMM